MKVRVPIAPIALLALCLGVGALLVVQIERPVRSPPIPELTAAASGNEAPRAPAAFVAPPAQLFAEITARPAFAMTRRPPPVAAPTAIVTLPPQPPAPPIAAKAITVLGIVGPPSKRIALLQPPSVSMVLSVAEGESVVGWQVQRILADRVVLQWNGTVEEISFPQPADKRAMPPLPSVKPPIFGNRRP